MHNSGKIKSVHLILMAFMSLMLHSELTSAYGWPNHQAQVQVLSDIPSNGPSGVQFLSTPNHFEGPFLSSVNSSDFEWWFLDAITPDLSTSVHFIFFTSTLEAYPLTTSNDILSTFVFLTFPNGSYWYNSIPATSAKFEWGGNLGNGIVSSFTGNDTHTFFAITPDLNLLTVSVNAPELSLSGSLQFKRTAPPHYPCSANIDAPNQNLKILPQIGWTNAFPSANVSGTLDILGITLDFDNAWGYQDMNWGSTYFSELVDSWYWGHANVGPYTIVWFDGISAVDGQEHVSAYIAEGDRVLLASCGPGSVVVRPEGVGAQYPPDSAHMAFSYLSVVFELGLERFVANITPVARTLAVPGLYQAYFGTASGGFEGGEVYNGIADFEQFALIGSAL